MKTFELTEQKAIVAALDRALAHIEYNLRHPASHCLALADIEFDIQTLQLMRVTHQLIIQLIIQRNTAHPRGNV